MNHDEAQREMAVERYLLGELSGEALEGFEEHLFECRVCSEEVKSAELMLEAARVEWRESGAERSGAVEMVAGSRQRGGWWTSPWVLGAALAACAVVVAVQGLIVIPGMRRQLAEAGTPAVLNTLVLASAGARSDAIPAVVAPKHGAFLLSVDVPSRANFSSYECSLYSPAGVMVWQSALTTAQTRDAVLIHMPVGRTQAGINTLLVQGVPAVAEEGRSGKLVDLARYRFQLTVQ